MIKEFLDVQIIKMLVAGSEENFKYFIALVLKLLMKNIDNLFVRLFVISLLTFSYFSPITSLFGAGAAPFFTAPAPAPAPSKLFRRLRLRLRLRPKCVGSGGSGSASLASLIIFFYFSPSTRDHVFPFVGGFLLLLKATSAAWEPTPRPFTTVGEPIPRTGRHRELNPGPPDLQTSALPTELTGRYAHIIGLIVHYTTLLDNARNDVDLLSKGVEQDLVPPVAHVVPTAADVFPSADEYVMTLRDFKWHVWDLSSLPKAGFQ